MAKLYIERQCPVRKAQRSAERKFAKKDSVDRSENETLQHAAPKVDLKSAPKVDPRSTAKLEPRSQPMNEQLSKTRINRITRAIPKEVVHAVWLRDGACCAAVSASTGKRCTSTFQLELDHIQPYSLGGLHTSENLRVVCRSHNQRRALH